MFLHLTNCTYKFVAVFDVFKSLLQRFCLTILACICQQQISLHERVLIRERRPHHVVVVRSHTREVVVHVVHRTHKGGEAPHHGRTNRMSGAVGAGFELIHRRRGPRFGRPGREQVVHVNVDGSGCIRPGCAQFGCRLRFGVVGYRRGLLVSCRL